MARRRPGARRSGRNRQGLLDSFLESAGEMVQSVAIEVVPPIVDVIDVDEVVQRIDLNTLLEKVDVDVLLEHLDIEALLARVDMNALLERVDIDAILARTELGSVVARSGGAIASRTLDVVRSQGVGLDAFVERWTNRLLRRTDPSSATGPTLLVTRKELATP